MSETRKLAAILVADVVGYSRLTGADEEGTLARLRTLRSDLINPTIAVHNGRVVKRTGDGAIVEFRSVVEAVRCAVEVRSGLAERNVGVPADKRIEARVGIHLGDVVEKADGDLMGDGVNVAARLESICEPGGICLSEDAYRQVRDKLSENFVDLGDQNLKNIARPVRTYALAPTAEGRPGVPSANVAPMPFHRRQRGAAVGSILTIATRRMAALAGATTGGRSAVRSASGLPSVDLESRDRRLRDRRLRRALIVSALIVLAAARVWRGHESSTAPPAPVPPPAAAVTGEKTAQTPSRSIVILPFANLSGDPAQDYLADALTDELTTSIARMPFTFVIARNTAFTYKDKPVEAKAIGKDLGVSYVLEGSMQPSAARVRVNVQLIDADSGAHLWAEQFDTPRADVLQTQDEIVARLAHALQFQLSEAEAARLKRTPAANPGAEALALQCLASVRKAPEAVSKEAEAGFRLCEQALSFDPDNVLALAILSIRFWQPVSHDLSDYPKADLKRGDELVSKALALDPTFAYGHVFKAEILRDQGRFEEANSEAERALALDPTAVDAYAQMAYNGLELGEYEKSLENLDKAIRLSPHDPSLHYWYASKATAHFALEQYEQAIEWARRAIAIDPTFRQSHPVLIAALGWTGRQAEAHDAIQRYLALFPTGPGTLAAWKAVKAQKTNSDSDPRVLEFWDRAIEGLRKAGLPEE